MKMEENLILKSFEFSGINDNEMRRFECWGSVEVIDRHGEIIPAEEVYKVMDIWMDRGSPIMFNHTNRQVGKGLNWQKAEKDGKKGVLITGMIYKHYKEDDEIWNGIKKGDFEGLSIGGKSYEKEETEDGTFLRKLIGYEFSVVERCGNQEATFVEVNEMAKNEEVKKEEPIMDEVSSESAEDKMAKLENIIAALTEKIAMIEEKISGGAEEETPVEEQKQEEETEEEAKPEETEKEEEETTEEETEEEEEEGEMKKELEEVKKELSELKKSTTVVKTIETPRPEEKPVEQKEDKYSEVSKHLDNMAKSGKIDFVELGKKIRG